MPRLLIVLLILALLVGFTAPGLAETCPGAEHTLWAKLLEAALVKTEEAHSLVKQVATEPPSKPLGELAAVLLEEWDLPDDAEELQQPRVVYSPKPDFSDLWEDGLALQYFNVVVSGQVTSSGTVVEPEINISTGAPEIDQRCLEAFSAWCYRPARGECGYTQGKVGAVCHINPREEQSADEQRATSESAASATAGR